MWVLMCMCRRELSSSHLSEAEFEEILQRNKTVSSSAISRAVQDASSGSPAFISGCKLCAASLGINSCVSPVLDHRVYRWVYL